MLTNAGECGKQEKMPTKSGWIRFGMKAFDRAYSICLLADGRRKRQYLLEHVLGLRTYSRSVPDISAESRSLICRDSAQSKTVISRNFPRQFQLALLFVCKRSARHLLREPVTMSVVDCYRMSHRLAVVIQALRTHTTSQASRYSILLNLRAVYSEVWSKRSYADQCICSCRMRPNDQNALGLQWSFICFINLRSAFCRLRPCFDDNGQAADHKTSPCSRCANEGRILPADHAGLALS